jgi:hypothetical protein
MHLDCSALFMIQTGLTDSDGLLCRLLLLMSHSKAMLQMRAEVSPQEKHLG